MGCCKPVGYELLQRIGRDQCGRAEALQYDLGPPWLRDPVWVASMTLLQFLQISRLFRMLLLSFVSSDVSG